MISLNVNGLNSPTKRRIVFDHLRKAKADICLVQETHSTPATEKIWKREWGGQGFFAHGSQSSRGVAVLTGRNLAFEVVKGRQDDEGRCMIVDLKLDGVVYTVGSIYAPTQDRRSEQLSFLEKLDEWLSDMDSTNLIMGGDYNCCLNPSLDKNNATSSTADISGPVRHKITTLIDDWNLCDLWRIRNPCARGYTFRRGKYASRLDYIFISNHLSDHAAPADPHIIVQSDHAMIAVSWKKENLTKGPGLWRLDNTLLQEEDFVLQMMEFLEGWKPPPGAVESQLGMGVVKIRDQEDRFRIHA